MTQAFKTPKRTGIAAALLVLLATMSTPALANHDIPTVAIYTTPDVGELVYYRTVEHGFLEGGFVGCAAVVTLTFTNGARVPVTGVSFSESRCQGANAACESFEGVHLVSSCVQSPFPPQRDIAIPFHFQADVIQEPLGCYREVYVAGDLTGDDVEDTRSPNIRVIGDCD